MMLFRGSCFHHPNHWISVMLNRKTMVLEKIYPNHPKSRSLILTAWNCKVELFWSPLNANLQQKPTGKVMEDLWRTQIPVPNQQCWLLYIIQLLGVYPMKLQSEINCYHRYHIITRIIGTIYIYNYIMDITNWALKSTPIPSQYSGWMTIDPTVEEESCRFPNLAIMKIPWNQL
jgi:hypothetical protein